MLMSTTLNLLVSLFEATAVIAIAELAPVVPLVIVTLPDPAAAVAPVTPASVSAWLITDANAVASAITPSVLLSAVSTVVLLIVTVVGVLAPSTAILNVIWSLASMVKDETAAVVWLPEVPTPPAV